MALLSLSLSLGLCFFFMIHQGARGEKGPRAGFSLSLSLFSPLFELLAEKKKERRRRRRKFRAGRRGLPSSSFYNPSESHKKGFFFFKKSPRISRLNMITWQRPGHTFFFLLFVIYFCFFVCVERKPPLILTPSPYQSDGPGSLRTGLS